MRYLLPMILVVSGSALSRAQPRIEPKDGIVTIPLTLHPAAAPKPLSRFALLPELKDAVVGNRVQGFFKVFSEMGSLFKPEETAQRDKWDELPLAEFPGKGDYGAAYLDSPARFTHADWQMLDDLRTNGVATLLPDIQRLRSFTPIYKVRFRGRVKAGEFEQAAVSARSLFALGKTCEAHPTIIGHLVGAAITAEAMKPLMEMIQQPKCPNLFWNLSDLPRPFLDTRLAIQGERLLLGSEFRQLIDATGPLSDADVNRVIRLIEQYCTMDEKRTGTPAAALWAFIKRSADADGVASARTRLIESGLKAAAVNSFTPLQVVVADDVRQAEIVRDGMMKWMNLPYFQMYDRAEAAEADMKKHKDEPGHRLALALVPMVHKFKQSQVGLDQWIAELTIVEAIRLHAFEHDNALPESLAAMKLPLPLDPVSGKPFEYSLKDGVARLHGATMNLGRGVRHYEVKLGK